MNAVQVPILTEIFGADLDGRIQFIVEGYFKYYDRDMWVPDEQTGALVYGNQVTAWKGYVKSRQSGLTGFGEVSGQEKSSDAAQSEWRYGFVFPNFYDPMEGEGEPLLPLLKRQYKLEGIDFPQTKTPAGKRAVMAFHKKYKDLFAVAEDR